MLPPNHPLNKKSVPLFSTIHFGGKIPPLFFGNIHLLNFFKKNPRSLRDGHLGTRTCATGDGALLQGEVTGEGDVKSHDHAAARSKVISKSWCEFFSKRDAHLANGP